MLTLHTLAKGRGRLKRRRGRGNASRGNYSGRGMKGQRARSGGKGGLKLLGLKQSFLGVPKKRGFTSPQTRPQIVGVAKLEQVFAAGAEIGLKELYKAGLILSMRRPVKILGKGKLSKKFVVKTQAASQGAREAITAAGGKFEVVELTRPVASAPDKPRLAKDASRPAKDSK